MADFLAGSAIWATWTAYGLILFIFLVMAPCHAVFLLPFIGIPLFWLLPLAYALPINLLIWLVSLFVFRMIRRAMIRPPMDGFHSLTGTTARVVSRSGADHSARYLIRAGGELWSAYSTDTLQIGEQVNIVAVKGISLGVERVNPDFRADAGNVL